MIFILALVLSVVQSNAQTKIIAHRGCSSLAPENTLAAFQKAIDNKVDYFELDVHKTKDDSMVVIHDSSVDRTNSNNVKGKISEMNYSEFAKLTVGLPARFGDTYKNEKIPSLREALQLAKDKIKVCIEIKTYGAEEAILKIIDELGVRDEVILFSFYYPVLAKIRQLDKNISILYLISKADKRTIDYAKIIKADAIGVDAGTKLSQTFLDFAHNNGVEVWKWTVNKEAEMKALMAIGLDGLITDFPDKALKIRDKIQN